MANELRRTEPTNSLRSLDRNTRQALEARQGPAVSSMPQAQRYAALRILLLNASVITGWPLPEVEIRNILIVQFEKMILESYPTFTIAEMEYAFRHHRAGESFGKEINLGLIKGALDSYKEIYQEARRYAKNEPLNASEGHIWTDEEMENEIRGKIQAYLGYLWEGKKAPLWLPHWGEVLVKDKFVRDIADVETFFEYCLDNGVREIYKKA